MTLPAKLTKRIEAFLAERSVSEGGFAPVGDKDLESMVGIMHALVEAKYEQDPDGDLPVSFHLVDRTRYQNTHFALIPHTRDAQHHDLQHLNQCLRAACMNLAIAQNQVEQVQRDMQLSVVEAMTNGSTVNFGKGVYERRTSLTDHSALAGKAKDLLQAYVAKQPPVLGDFKKSQEWIEQAQKAISKRLDSPVRVRAHTSFRKPEDTVVSVELLGIHEEDTHRHVRFVIPTPTPVAKSAPNAGP
jgi:hypothetical protein